MIKKTKNNLEFKTILNFIKSRLQTEKTNNLFRTHIYTFLVDRNIKKDKIKLIFKEIYGSIIYNINTCILPIKFKKIKNFFGIKPQFKKVYIKLNI